MPHGLWVPGRDDAWCQVPLRTHEAIGTATAGTDGWVMRLLLGHTVTASLAPESVWGGGGGCPLYKAGMLWAVITQMPYIAER